MGPRRGGGSTPPSVREQLAIATGAGRLGSSAPVPMWVHIESLAKRWGVPPWVLDSDDSDVALWVRRGLYLAGNE